MSTFCLPKYAVDAFKKALKDGTIDPTKLAEMSSVERRSLLSKFVGEENAVQVNALFESKLLLKNQQVGMINWAKKVAGLSPEVRRDILSKVERLDKVLEPKEQAAFLEDLVAQRMGFGVTLTEAGRITELSREVALKKEAMEKGGEPLEYTEALVDFMDYVSELKIDAQKIHLRDFRTAPLSTAGKALLKGAGMAKSFKATLDMSHLLRQGLKLFINNPNIWGKLAVKSFNNFYRAIKGENVLRETRIRVLAHKRALNGEYKRENLAVGVKEEAFPGLLPSERTFLGRLFNRIGGRLLKASEETFTAFLYEARAELFDYHAGIIESIPGASTKGLGLYVNSMTGRGKLGRFEPIANELNVLWFSPRLLKSNWDTLTMHGGQWKDMSPYVRKQAAYTLVRTILAVGAVLTVAKALNSDSVETDSRSSGFGKIKVGNTRFDVTGGMGGLAILATRLARLSSKSSTSGKITPLNSGKFGAPTVPSVVWNFFENKLSPAASVVNDLLKNSDFKGDKPTFAGELSNLALPLPIKTFTDLKNDDESANLILAMIADMLGISTNTYSGK